MVLASVLVGNGNYANGSPMEPLFCQHRSSREAGDDISVMEDNRIGKATFVERECLFDLRISGNSPLVVNRGGGSSHDDDGVVGLGANLLHLPTGSQGDGAFSIDVHKCNVSHHHVDAAWSGRYASPEILMAEISVFHNQVVFLVHAEIS